MKNLEFGRIILSSCVAAAILAGCGGSQPPIGAPGAIAQGVTESAQYAHSGPRLYVVNQGFPNVAVYRADSKDPSEGEVISDGLRFPSGVCLDGEGTLYVTDYGDRVVEYPAGEKKPSRIITKGMSTPEFCAIDGKGNLWVTNMGGPNVTEYLKGSAKLETVITEGLTYPDGIAIDRSGNMYVSNGSYGPYNVVVYPPRSTSPSRTITDGITSPVGVAVDAHGTLYVANQTQNNVEEYRSGTSYPYQTITDGIDQPVAVTVSKSGYLYVTNYGEYNFCKIVEFAPGSITPSDRQISKGLLYPWGTAYSPPLLP
jgi:serine/threonine-protein kinase